MESNRLEVPLGNGFRIVAERNTDSSYDREIFIGITDGNGVWWQDLAIVRTAYEIDSNLKTVWNDDKFEVLVYSDQNNEDYTHKFAIGLYHGGI